MIYMIVCIHVSSLLHCFYHINNNYNIVHTQRNSCACCL